MSTIVEGDKKAMLASRKHIDVNKVAQETINYVYSRGVGRSRRLEDIIKNMVIDLKYNDSFKYGINDDHEFSYIFDKDKFMIHLASKLEGHSAEYMDAMEEALKQSQSLGADRTVSQDGSPSAYSILLLVDDGVRQENGFFIPDGHQEYEKTTTESVRDMGRRIRESERRVMAVETVKACTTEYRNAVNKVLSVGFQSGCVEDTRRTVAEMRNEFVGCLFKIDKEGAERDEEVSRIMKTKLGVLLNESGKDGVDRILANAQMADEMLLNVISFPVAALDEVTNTGKLNSGITYYLKKEESARAEEKSTNEMYNALKSGDVEKAIQAAFVEAKDAGKESKTPEKGEKANDKSNSEMEK